jgi:hypothetical protein
MVIAVLLSADVYQQMSMSRCLSADVYQQMSISRCLSADVYEIEMANTIIRFHWACADTEPVDAPQGG